MTKITRIPKELLEQFIQAGEVQTTSQNSAPQTVPVINIQHSQKTLEEEASDNRERKTQNVWISWYNEQGKIMASAPDIYNTGKCADEKLLESLRKDFKDYWIVTSTRIIYDKDSLDGRIIHYFGSEVIKPGEITSIKIPIYRGAGIQDVLNDENGLDYLNCLFNIGDDPDDAIKTLENLNGQYKKDKIKIWTPDQDSRRSYSERAAGFYFDGGGFHISGGSRVGDGGGYSRGVHDSSREAGTR